MSFSGQFTTRPSFARFKAGATLLAFASPFAFAAAAHAGIYPDEGERGAPVADAADAADADADAGAIVVTARSATADAERLLDAVPGGTGLVDQGSVEKGRVLTNQDVLAYQPGVYAQAAGGADGLKISIRGSAINRGTNFFRTGILFEFDGLPVTGPGGTGYELFEPLGLKYTEILRGANGFDRGSSYLGGAINYVTKTGREADLLEARIEGGSYGYLKGQLASGGVLANGNIDYYVSATYSQRRGYQVQAGGDSFGVIGNIGIRLSDSVETRFYARYRQTWNETPGSLLRSEIDGNPRLADPLNVARNAIRIQPGTTWLANKTTITFGDTSTLSIGFVYHDYPIDIRTQNRAVWAYTDLSQVVDYVRTDTLFGRESTTRFGILNVDHTRGWQAVYNRYTVDPGTGAAAVSGTPADTLTRFSTYDGADRNFHLSNVSEPLPGLKVTIGGALLNILRKTAVVYPATYVVAGETRSTVPYRRASWDYTVRGGLAYAVTPEVQLYSNVSRSVEPANDWSHLSTPPAFPAGSVAVTQALGGLPLKDQTAWSVELGARGHTPIFGNWEVSAYRAWVRNELLSVIVDRVNNVTAESNASPTIHQGIEVGFDTRLWQSPGSPDTNISTRQSYTYSDFRFAHDATFAQNQLPSLPRHFYQGQISFNHASGFYASADVQAASGYPVDYANSFYTRDYAIFGATLGYAPKESQWSAFLDFRNIGDKGYVASVSPVYNDLGRDQRRSSPGDGFSVIAGLSIKIGR